MSYLWYLFQVALKFPMMVLKFEPQPELLQENAETDFWATPRDPDWVVTGQA